MFKATTVSSIEACPQAAGKEVALKIKDSLTKPQVVFAYASCNYDLDGLLKSFTETLPDVPIIGNTSFTGVITPEGFVGGDTFIGAMALEDEALTVGVAALPKKGDARQTGKEVALQALKAAGKQTPPCYFYMVAPPGEEEYYLKGISEVIGRVPFFGGSAADNSIEGYWKLYTQSGAFADGVAVAFFYTDKPFANEFTGAYHETEDVGIITKIVGDRTLAEIDGVPALQKYADWTGVDVESLRGGALLVATITSPLGVKDPLGDLVAIRHPMNGNADDSMAVGNNLAEHTAIIRMTASVDELIASTGETLTTLQGKLETPGAYHLVHCGGRRAGIGDRIDEVAEAIKKVAGDTPFIVEFTFGEYGYADDGRNTCGGLMLSFSGFGK